MHMYHEWKINLCCIESEILGLVTAVLSSKTWSMQIYEEDIKKPPQDMGSLVLFALVVSVWKIEIKPPGAHAD